MSNDLFRQLLGAISKETWIRSHSEAILVLQPPDPELTKERSGLRARLRESDHYRYGRILELTFEAQCPPSRTSTSYWSSIWEDGQELKWVSAECSPTDRDYLRRLWEAASVNKTEARAAAALKIPILRRMLADAQESSE